MDPHALSWDDVAPARPQRETMRARFYRAVEYDEGRSLTEGVPRYNGHDMVELTDPQSPNKVVRKRVDDTLKARFRRQWELYDAAREPAVEEGTPIEQMHYLSPERIAGLKHANIRTVEKLASLPPDLARKHGPGMVRAVSLAKRVLAGPGAEIQELRAENEALKAEIADLRGRLMNPRPERAPNGGAQPWPLS